MHHTQRPKGVKLVSTATIATTGTKAYYSYLRELTTVPKLTTPT